MSEYNIYQKYISTLLAPYTTTELIFLDETPFNF